MNIQLSSAIMTTLYLEGVHLDQCFSELTADGVASECFNFKVPADLHHVYAYWALPFVLMLNVCAFQDTICQCKKLVILHIVFQLFHGGGDLPEHAMQLLMEFLAALPNLATYQWRELLYCKAAGPACQPCFSCQGGSS